MFSSPMSKKQCPGTLISLELYPDFLQSGSCSFIAYEDTGCFHGSAEPVNSVLLLAITFGGELSGTASHECPL